MGKRGPKPTPTKVLALHGSWRANTRPNEPKPAIEAPVRPAGLDRVAQAEWKRIVGQLEEHGLITKLDRSALEGYCVHYSLWRKYLTALKKMCVGTTSHRRVAACASDAYGNMMKAAALFGMSPADRTRVIRETPKKDEDPMERFLRSGGRASA